MSKIKTTRSKLEVSRPHSAIISLSGCLSSWWKPSVSNPRLYFTSFLHGYNIDDIIISYGALHCMQLVFGFLRLRRTATAASVFMLCLREGSPLPSTILLFAFFQFLPPCVHSLASLFILAWLLLWTVSVPSVHVRYRSLRMTTTLGNSQPHRSNKIIAKMSFLVSLLFFFPSLLLPSLHHEPHGSYLLCIPTPCLAGEQNQL